MSQTKNRRVLNSNALKFLAAFFMVIDHVGLFFFPYTIAWRCVGRLALPMFAFALSEGCRYTKNKTKHFAVLCGAAVLCQIAYYLFAQSLTMSVFVTFTFSVAIIYAMQAFKKSIFETHSLQNRISSGILFLVSVLFTWQFCRVFSVDYGFWGCLLPVFASVFDFRGIENVPQTLQSLDRLPVRIACTGVGLLLLCMASFPITVQFYSLLALPILLLYNGEKGVRNTKYFFYIFYPAHLALLQILYWIL